MADILIIEDNDTLRDGMVEVVERMDHQAIAAGDGKSGLQAFKRMRPDLVVTDLKMDAVDGMEVLQDVIDVDPEAIVMIATAFGSIEKAVDAMKGGAFDFIPKPFPPDLLRTKIDKALQVKASRNKAERLSSENEMLRRDAGHFEPSEIVGDSAAMKDIYATIDKVAPTDSTVYIYGESGTGKELVAKAIHDASGRADGPFIRVNCSALAETLLESELFGHEKGAFTGAHRRRLGRFELADGGTLFLDEIGDVSPVIQLKLLRVLQEQTFERVGGQETVEVDVRVLTATNKDLKEQVDRGEFRQDLFYRLHIIPVTLPPLRERADDIELLVDHFLSSLAGRTRSDVDAVAPDVLETMRAYGWPGNVRELENVIEYALVFAEGDTIHLADLPAAITGRDGDDVLAIPDGDRSLPDILEDLEKQLIIRAYDRADGVKTETARRLGIKTSALYYKLEKYGID